MIFLSISIYYGVNSVLISIFHPKDLHMAERFEWKDFNPIEHMLIPILAAVGISSVLSYIFGFIRLGLRNGHLFFLSR